VAFDYQFTNMGNELTLATFCHENGHMVCDYPDLYDYGHESSGVGAYCLMCSGGRDEKNPTQICAYLKYLSGWGSPVTPLTHGLDLTLSAGKNEFALFSKNQLEYFIIENRHTKGRDASLPASGLAIWHVDEEGSNNNEQMLPNFHYEASLEQADNKFELERQRRHIGDSADLFHAGGNARFADTTGPASKWWDGTPSNLDIYNIGEKGDNIRFKVKLFEEDETLQKYQKKSEPQLEIPDQNSAGIRDTIHFNDSALISTIKISVDIKHTYRGDLKVTLLPPLGNPITLHERHQGGSENDLITTYNDASVTALRSLKGQSMRGNWVLHVQDLAAQDTGILNSWEIEIEGIPDRLLELEESPGIRIPDEDPAGIERTLSSDVAGKVKSIEVSLEITHTFIHDLIVTLVSPTGINVDLHNRMGGAADNIMEIYTQETKPELNEFKGKPILGDWKLKISDHVGQDVGKLNRWSLKIIYEK